MEYGMKKFIIILIGYIAFSCGVFAQTSLSVVAISGEQQMYAVSVIGKIVFQDSIMRLYSHSGQILGSTPISSISKMVFTENATDLEQTDTNIIVFPNPTSDNLYIKGLYQEGIVRIYSIQGQLLLSTPIKNQEATISVQQLPQGVYYLQLGAQLFKFIKK